MLGLIPRGTLEVLLFLTLVAAFFAVFRAVQKRKQFAPPPAPAEALPTLATEIRVRATPRRLFRDPHQGLWMVEASIGQRRFTFCAADYASHEEEYKVTGQPTDFALYALATLAPGGVDAIRDRIKDIDKVEVTPDLVRLVHTGPLANDYAVIGRIISERRDTLDDDPVTVYRAEVVRQSDFTLMLDLATEPGDPLPPDTMAHGSARLFGYRA